MQHIRLLGILLITLLIIIGVQHVGVKSAKQAVQSENIVATTSPILLSPSPTISPTLRPTSLPTNIPVVKTTPSPTGVSQQGFNSWYYPGATQTSGTTLQTSTDANTVTDWYVAKIAGAGMNVKSTVRTKTNGMIKNVVAGANGQESIKVEIQQTADQGITTITLTR